MAALYFLPVYKRVQTAGLQLVFNGCLHVAKLRHDGLKPTSSQLKVAVLSIRELFFYQSLISA